MGEMVSFPSNGGQAQGYLAAPAGGGPGVIVIQEWWGLVDHIKDVAERYAAEGLVALAPDLYHGRATREPDEAQKLMMALRMDEAAKDLSGAVDYLLARPDSRGKLGVTGFCMGGGLALMAACKRPEIAACVPYYGVVMGDPPDFTNAKAAVLGHYAEIDGWASPEAAEALERELRSAGLDTTFHIYRDCEHAFFNDTRPEVYDAAAAKQSWARTLEFFRKLLG